MAEANDVSPNIAREKPITAREGPITARESETQSGTNFIRAIIENDLRNNKYGGRIVTRFPPEPNGYLHIGHAKSICLNFGLARDYQGRCNLRFDDTNPATEDVEYVDSIKHDVRWLGFDWDDREFYASDYFEDLYQYAVQLVTSGKAYVDSLDEEAIRAHRGTVTEPGRESPYRNRTIDENLELFEGMRAGDYRDGEHVLRGKIDMTSPNMKMRDPLLYRIRHAHHYRAGDEWCIYPMYDFAHPLSDAIEGITHSLCTLEFDNNRELYDWVLENTVGEPRPHQYEFARLYLDYTLMSKRKLLQLVRDRHVAGWDDPRMPTLAGLRRRGVTPESIRTFCDRIGVAKSDSRVDIDLLEHTLRDDLNFKAPRVMCVLRPLKVIITNYPEGDVEWLDASYWPHDVPREGSRKIPFGREILIDRDDFREDPPRGYYRLALDREVRLRYGYFITCRDMVRDSSGEPIELHCTYDPDTKGGNAPDGRKVRGTIHWVSASHALPAEIRLYDRLFSVPDPEAGDEGFEAHLNPDSLVVLDDCMVEPSVAGNASDTRYQFEREGYFWRDPVDSKDGLLVFNRIVPLRDTWARKQEADRTGSVKVGVTAPAAKAVAVPKTGAATMAAMGTTADRASELKGRARERFDELHSMGLEVADAVILAENPDVAEFFRAAAAAYDSPQTVANWVVNELLRELKGRSIEAMKLSADQFADLVKLTDEEVISARVAKEVFAEMIETGRGPAEIVDERNLEQVSNPEELKPAVEAVIRSFSEKVEAYRGGKTGLLGFFVGQVMQQTGGKADPRLVKALVEERLNG